MTVFTLSSILHLALVASAHEVNWKTNKQLGACQYPSNCQDNCEESVGHTGCPDPSSDCPCIIKACWSLNDSCIHACNETALLTCLQCVSSGPDTMCPTECSAVCLDAKCKHSQGECHRCVPGVYGQSCSQGCSSLCGGSCNRDTGYCTVCQPRRHGLECEHTCPDLCRTCSPADGSCLLCVDGYKGQTCSTPCPDGVYGSDCHQTCSENCARTCDRISGHCIGGCKPGYYRADCTKQCPAGSYGQDCASECAVTCAVSSVCHHTDGSCINGCSPGFRGQHCGILCSLGTFGANCSSNCSDNCFFGVCNRFSGHCQRCDVGRAGLFCEHLTRDGRVLSHLEDDMSIDQTILIFLGLFAMGGAMWFLLGTLVYYKQKIITKKMRQTGQLPDNWTSLVRRYPQYFYNPRFLYKSTGLTRATSTRADRVPAVQRRERRQAGHSSKHQGHKVTRQLRQGLPKNVEITEQRKDLVNEGHRDNPQITEQRKDLVNEGQRDNPQITERRKDLVNEGQRDNSQITEQRKDLVNEGQRDNSQMNRLGNCQGKGNQIQGQSENAENNGQRKNLVRAGRKTENNMTEHSRALEKEIGKDKTSSLLKTQRRNCCHGQSPDNLPESTMDLDKKQITSARSHMHETRRDYDNGELATTFAMGESLKRESDIEEAGQVVSGMESVTTPGLTKPTDESGTTPGLTKPTDESVTTPGLTKPTDESGTVDKALASMDDRQDGAGDTKSSTLLDMTITSTAGMDTGLLAPHDPRHSSSTTQGKGMPSQLPHRGISVQQESYNKRSPQDDMKYIAGEPGTSATSVVCTVCGKQSAWSMDCQCSAGSTAHIHRPLRAPLVLARAKASSFHQHLGTGNLQVVVERGLSHTTSSYSNVKLPAAHARDALKPPPPLVESKCYRGQRVSRSRHTLASSLDTSRVEVSTVGDTDGGSSETGTLTSGSSTNLTSKMKTEASTGTGTEGEVSESMSTTIVSSAITETSEQDNTSARSSKSERRRRFFQAALERQSQPYLAKVDMWTGVEERNTRSGLRDSHKPRGLFQRSLRNMVGALNKLLGGVPQPQQAVVTTTALIDSSKTFTQNQALSSQLLIHRLESWRRGREAGTEPHVSLTEKANKKQRRASSRAEKVSMAETLTEGSSVVSNTQRTSSRTAREDSTLTDDSEFSTGTSSLAESVSTTLRSSEASSSEASSTTSGTSQESTDKHTLTDVDSLPVNTRTTRRHQSRHHRSHRSKRS